MSCDKISTTTQIFSIEVIFYKITVVVCYIILQWDFNLNEYIYT